MASAWHEGWEPNREDVENVTDPAGGAIDDDEYLRNLFDERDPEVLRAKEYGRAELRHRELTAGSAP